MVTFDTHKALFRCNHLGCIAMMPFASCIPFTSSVLCHIMLTMLVYATYWLYMHLYTLAYMSMHESCLLVCRLYFNIMKQWTSDQNLHLSLVDTIFCLFLACLLSHLFACFLASLLAMPIMLIHFMPLHMFFCIFSFYCLYASFLSLPLHVHTWSKDAWS